jgi:hypothetical protein
MKRRRRRRIRIPRLVAAEFRRKSAGESKKERTLDSHPPDNRDSPWNRHPLGGSPA